METATYENVQEIARIEREALLRRSRAERLGDLIANHAGRVWFIVLHTLWFLLWIGLNAGWGPQALGF